MAASQSSVSALGSRHQELAAQHSALESQLQQLHQKRFLSAEEELEAVRLKKLKLHLKDAMRGLQSGGTA
jgi:uncharacterized protein YdcH (DUF465 family)